MEEHFSKLNHQVAAWQGVLLALPCTGFRLLVARGICGDVGMCSYRNTWSLCEAIIWRHGCPPARSSGWLSSNSIYIVATKASLV